MSFIVCGYYTKDTIYEEMAQTLEASLQKFKVPFYIQRIKSRGNWHDNTSYKPTFLLEMLEKFDDDIIYVDCDAEFFEYPKLFDDLNCNVGVHYFDRSLHGSSCKGFEVLSGTIFLRNCDSVKDQVELWEVLCKRTVDTWDQKHLESVLAGDFYNLPEEYCVIFDVMSHVKSPVIKHYQASRELRRTKSLNRRL